MYLTEKHMSIASCVAVQHDRQSRVANSSLAGHIEVVITQDLRVSSVWYEHAWATGSLCCQSCPTALSLWPCAGCCAPFWNSSLMPCHTCLADFSWAIVQQLQSWCKLAEICFSNHCRNLLMACCISSWSGLASMFSSLCCLADLGPTVLEVGLECAVESHENLCILWYPQLFWDINSYIWIWNFKST